MIKVKRYSDGKVFTNDMSSNDGIYEIHFCSSYTQVLIQEKDGDKFTKSEILIKPIGTKANPLDMIAVNESDEWGMWL